MFEEERYHARMHTVCIFIYAYPSIGSLGGVRWWRQAAVRVQGSRKWCSGPLQGGFGFSGSERFCSCLAGQNPRRLLSYSQFCICWVWSTYVDQCWLAARIWRASVKQLKLIFHIYIYIYIYNHMHVLQFVVCHFKFCDMVFSCSNCFYQDLQTVWLKLAWS